MKQRRFLQNLILLAVYIGLSSCSEVAEWPDSPLYTFNQLEPRAFSSNNIDSVMNEIVGHYAHYDVVAYEDTTTKTTMRTFIVSYGFTDFFLEDGKLMQSDRFVQATQKLSNVKAKSSISDEAVQAIKPRVQEVELNFEDGEWNIYRPSTPVLLGISGDPSLPLSRDKNDPNITDPDNDGQPGVTVNIQVGKSFSGEIYITRREIYSNYLRLNSDGSISGYIEDESEQFVLGASMKVLAQASNNIQHPDKGLNPVLLVPISEDIDTPEELMKLRDVIFPLEPTFEK